MTDEEMAEEYVKENTPLFNALGKEMTYTYKYMKQAYLAGLKASRPEWHKVADGDLPKEEDLEIQVLCFTTDGYRLLSLFSDPKPIFKGYGVIAWCEIPKYTEE